MVITAYGPTDSPAFDLEALLARFPAAGGPCPRPAEPRLPVYLSWGMGVESTAILVRWLLDPSSRDFDLGQLTVIVAQTGDEWEDTRLLSETYLFPLLRRFGVRVVQVARAGHLEADGIEVLDDTRAPETLYIDGAYKLSDELAIAGTVPQFAGVHRCALKFKAWVIERWFDEEVSTSFRHAIGYNADETARVEKSEYANAMREAGGKFRLAFGYNSEETERVEKSEYMTGLRNEAGGRKMRVAFGFNSEETGRIERAGEYDGLRRLSFHPLLDWSWNRWRCHWFLWLVFGVSWEKSACVFCPFNALKEDAMDRLRRSPAEVAKALLVEHRSLCLNYRGTLYRSRSLRSVVEADGQTAALEAFRLMLENQRMGLYRVRRVYTKKGTAHRCVEVRCWGNRAAMEDELRAKIFREGLELVKHHGMVYGYRLRRDEDTYPSREEFYVVAPATVQAKARYGQDWFEEKWEAAALAPPRPEPAQATLFG